MKINGLLNFDASSASEIQNLRVEKLASNPTYTSADNGRLIYNTTSGVLYYGQQSSTSWVAFATGGSAFPQAEGDQIEAALGGGYNTTSNLFDATAFPSFPGGTPTSFTSAINQLASYADSNNELSELDDVTLTALATGQFLVKSSGNWVNQTLVLANVTDVTSTAAEVNQLNGGGAVTADFVKLHAVTATALDLNLLTGLQVAGVTGTEIGFVTDVTSNIQAQLDGKQPLDATLTSLANFSATGIVVSDGADGFFGRALVAPAAGIAITNANGVAGAPTFALANDLAALEGLATTGYIVRTADGAATTRAITGTASNIVVTNGSGVTSDTSIDLAGVTQAPSGDFVKVTLDAFGRVTGNTAVTTADITSLVDATYVNVTGDTMTGTLNMGNFYVTMTNAPVGDTDAANKAYVDAVAAGLSWKQAVNAASVGNLTLSGTQTVDGVALIAGDRVLVKDQTLPAENGVYVVAAGAWVRSTNMDAAGEFLGATLFVLNGTVNDNSGWTQTNSVAAVGTDPVSFVQFSGSSTYTWGTGLVASGNTINVNMGAGIIELPSDEVGLHIESGKAVQLTGTGLAAGDQLTFVLDGGAASGLEQSQNGLKISADGVTNAMLLNEYFTLNGDTGTPAQRALGQTIEIKGTAVDGIATAYLNGSFTVSAVAASTTQRGTASFNTNDFTVTAGAVSIASIGNAQIDNAYINVAGTTGGNQQIALGGVVSFVGATAPITTVSSAGTITIAVADATAAAKGLASFNADQFTVVAGAVSLSATLDDLTNVSSSDAAATDSLLTKSATDWVPVTRAAMVASTSVGDHNDVTLSGVAAGETLVYSTAASAFVNRKVFHTEAMSSGTTWTVTHGLGQQWVNVSVAVGGEMVIPQSITFTSATVVTVTFNTAVAGQVMVSGVSAA